KAAVTITVIPRNRMANILSVNTNLVGSASDWACLNQSRLRELFQNLEAGFRRFSIRVDAHNTVDFVLQQRSVDHFAAVFPLAHHECEVILLYGFLSKLAL